MAGVDEMHGGSPTPLAPSGACGSGSSISVATTVGHVEHRRQQVVGEAGVADAAVDLDDLLHHRQARGPGRCRPRSGRCTDSGLSARPTSWAVATCTTFTSPSSRSTSTTARWATNANAVWQLPWPFSSSSSVGRWRYSTVSLEHDARRSRRRPARAATPDRVDHVGAVDRQPQRVEAVRRADVLEQPLAHRPAGRVDRAAAHPRLARRRRRAGRADRSCRSARARPRRRRGSSRAICGGDRDEALADLGRWRT